MSIEATISITSFMALTKQRAIYQSLMDWSSVGGWLLGFLLSWITNLDKRAS